ncbi:VOC family protein [Streptomyces sp. NPDC006458]|uniref:VOC family protein n=1 Tax=Streptomyces sp. NPDC006458 TaxID=3154302 RepID=UPI0033B2BAB3
MTAGVKTIIYPVKDMERAKAVFGALLGVEPYADTPFYVGYKDAGQDVGLDPNGHAQGLTGPVPYWHVDDIRATLAALLAAGAETLQEVRDVGNGRLIASVKDADGNLVGLLQDPEA